MPLNHDVSTITDAKQGCQLTMDYNTWNYGSKHDLPVLSGFLRYFDTLMTNRTDKF